jgi:RND family efflux transporter MFP subunit
MTEGRLLILGALPMIAGALWLVSLRRPEVVSASSAAAAQRAARAEAAVSSADEATFLGVVVAGYTADVGAEVTGAVTEVLASVGARVKEGEALLRVDADVAADDLRASRAKLDQQRSEIAAAEADLAEASDLVERLQGMSSGVSDRQVVAARAREQQARAALAQAEAGLSVQQAALGQQLTRSGKHTIRAPFDGILVERFVDPGGLVLPGQVVVRVITDDYYVRFAMPPAVARSHRVGDAVRIELPDGAAPLLTSVSDVQPEVDASAQMVFARARLPGSPEAKAALRPGVRVRVAFVAGQASQGGG